MINRSKNSLISIQDRIKLFSPRLSMTVIESTCVGEGCGGVWGGRGGGREEEV